MTSSIVITTAALEIVASDGSDPQSFNYFQDSAEVVTALSSLMGKPAVTPYEAMTDTAEGVAYKWDGFTLMDPTTDVVDPYSVAFYVIDSAPSVNGVDIATIDGIRVGDAAEQVKSQFPDDVAVITPTGDVERVDLRVDVVNLPPLASVPGEPLNNAVWIVAKDLKGAIESILAPSPSWSGF